MKLASALWGSYYPFDVLTKKDKTPLFEDFYVASIPDHLQPDSALVVWGGGDISPSLYGKKVGSHTGANASLSKRDFDEWQLMKRAKEMGIPIIGVCRGAQMLCALAGGFLVQDVTNHGRSHAVDTKDGKRFTVSSLHHQMLYPFDVEHEMLAWSANKISDHYMDVDELGKDKSISVEIEPEAVWFPQEKGFAIQGHPEFVKPDTHFNVWVGEQIEELMLKG